MEDGEDALFLLGDVLGESGAGAALQNRGRMVPLGGHLPHVPPQGLGDLEAPDLPREHGRGGLRDLLGIARGEDRQAEFLGLPQEFVHGLQPHGHQHRVALEGLLGARDDLPAIIQAGDGHPLDLLPAMGRDHRMARIDGHAHAHQLVLVDLVAAALLQRLAEPHHLDARLEGMVGRDEAHVAAADDEEALRGAHHVPVHQGLEGPGAVDARQGVALEDQGLLPGTRGNQEHLGPHQHVVPLAQEAHPAIREHGDGRGLRPDAHILEAPDLGLQLLADVPTAGARVAGLDAAEELVGLEDELASQGGLVVHQDHAHSRLGQLDGGGKPGGSAAQDEHFRLHGLDLAEFGPRPHLRQRGAPLEGLHRHARPHAHHAGLHGEAVGQDGALGALAIGAENALRRTVLVMVAEDPHAVGEEGRGNDLPLPGQHGLPLPGEGHGGLSRRGKDGVFLDAEIGHAGTPRRKTDVQGAEP